MPLNTAKIDDYSKGVDWASAQEELESGFVGGVPHDPNGADYTVNVEPTGEGGSIQVRRPLRRFEVVTPVGNPPPALTFRNREFSHMKPFGVDPWQSLIMTTNHGVLGILWVIGTASGTGDYEEVATGAGTNWDFVQAQDTLGGEYIWAIGSMVKRKVDATSGVAVPWPGLGALPAGLYALRVWKNRMILGGASVGTPRNRLWYSAIGNPESFPTNNFIDIKSTDDEQERITALENVGENLLVFKENSVWLVYDPVGFENRRIDQIGCISREAVTTAPNGRVYWVARNGIYSTDGDTIRYESRAIEPVFRQEVAFYGEMFENEEYVRIISTHDNKILFWQSGQGTGMFVYELDLNVVLDGGLSPWYVHGGPGSALQPSGMASLISTEGHSSAGKYRQVIVGTNGGALSGGTEHKFTDFFMHGIYDTDRPDAYSGAGTHPINAKYVSPWLEIQGTENFERLRRINALGRGEDFTLKILVDFDYTTAVFDSTASPKDTGPHTEMLRWRPETRGRLHRLVVKFAHGLTESVRGELHSIEIKYRGGKEH